MKHNVIYRLLARPRFASAPIVSFENSEYSSPLLQIIQMHASLSSSFWMLLGCTRQLTHKSGRCLLPAGPAILLSDTVCSA